MEAVSDQFYGKANTVIYNYYIPIPLQTISLIYLVTSVALNYLDNYSIL
jgi:hypothetical protein